MTERDVHAGNGTRAAEAEARADADADRDDALANVDDPTSAEYSVAFTPRNVAVGLAIVAGLVAFALSRRRRGGGRSDQDA
jgi:hypothetical protein